jgi:WD40 repeat protein
MSPEQALAKQVVIDHRTDVYSLGVTLYELLTLEPAYGGRNREEVLRQIAFEEPRPPRSLNRSIPGELETIVLKAIAKNPEERYATAQELADDLKRFLEDKPIKAKRPSLRQRAVKWARRHKTVVRAALVVLILAVVALAVSTVLIWQAKEDLKQALERERRLHEQERQNVYYQRIALAEREWSANNLSRMQQLLEECPPDLRGWEWRYLNRLRYKTLPPLCHGGAVLCAVFSPDGQRIASSEQKGWVKVWDAQTGRELLKFRAHQEHARTVAFSPDGRRLATASWDGTVKTWDARTGQQLPVSKRHEGQVGSVAFSPDGRFLASGSSSSEASGVHVCDAATGDEVRMFRGPNKAVWSIAFSPDGKRLAANGPHQAGQAGSDVTVTVWDVSTGQQQLTFGRGGHGLAFSPDGRLLVSGSQDHTVRVWDIQTGRELLCLRGHTAQVSGVAFSPDGRRLASGSQDQTVKVWDVRTGQEVLTLRGHSGSIFRVAFSPDGHRLVSASQDETVRVWDGTPAEGKADPDCLTLGGHAGSVNIVAFHPTDPSMVASAGADSSVRLWDAESGRQLRVLNVHGGNLIGLAFSPKGQRLAAAGQPNTVRVWDPTTGQEVPPSPLACNSGGSVAFSPDGRLLALARWSKKSLLIWDAANGELIHELPNRWVNMGVAFSPDSRHIATANNDGTVRVWDVMTAIEVVSPPLRHGAAATSVAFSPDGKRLASGSHDRTLKVWDTTTWKPLLVLSDPTGGVLTVAFSPDGKGLAGGSTDATIKVWDETGVKIQTLRGHTGWVTSVAFSPDGKQIASASADGTVKIWKSPPAAELPREEAGNRDP